MRFKNGANVYTADGKDVGRVERVVLDPTTRQVTHIIVRHGFIFTEDKAVPISYFHSQNEDSLVLRSDISSLDDVPRFEETHYVRTDWQDEDEIIAEEALFWYPPAAPGSYPMLGVYGPPIDAMPLIDSAEGGYVRRVEHQNIPDDTIALQEGMPVISADGQSIGRVDQVILDASNKATHIILTQGMILHRHKLIPTFWFRSVTEDEIRLAVPASFVENLPDYHNQAIK